MPVEVKEIQADIYIAHILRSHICIYSQNRLPSSKSAIRKLEALSEKYVLLDSPLFRIAPEKGTVVLAIPGTCADKINNPISQKLVCRAPRCNQNLFDNK